MLKLRHFSFSRAYIFCSKTYIRIFMNKFQHMNTSEARECLRCLFVIVSTITREFEVWCFISRTKHRYGKTLGAVCFRSDNRSRFWVEPSGYLEMSRDILVIKHIKFEKKGKLNYTSCAGENITYSLCKEQCEFKKKLYVLTNLFKGCIRWR